MTAGEDVDVAQGDDGIVEGVGEVEDAADDDARGAGLGLGWHAKVVARKRGNGKAVKRGKKRFKSEREDNRIYRTIRISLHETAGSRET